MAAEGSDLQKSLQDRAADHRHEAAALETLSALIDHIEETGTTVMDCGHSGPEADVLHAQLDVAIPVGVEDDAEGERSTNLYDFEEPGETALDDFPDVDDDPSGGKEPDDSVEDDTTDTDDDTDASAGASDDEVEAAVEQVQEDADHSGSEEDEADASDLDYDEATADDVRGAIADHAGFDYDAGEFTVAQSRRVLAALLDEAADAYADTSGRDLKPEFADALDADLACAGSGPFYLRRDEVEAVHRQLTGDTTVDATEATDRGVDDGADESTGADDTDVDTDADVPPRTISTTIDYDRLAAVDADAPADTSAFQTRAESVVEAFRAKVRPDDYTYVRTGSIASEAGIEEDTTTLLLDLFTDAGGVAEFDVERFGKTDEKTRWRVERHDVDASEEDFAVGEEVPEEAAATDDEDARADGGTTTASALPYAFPTGWSAEAVRDELRGDASPHLKDLADTIGMPHGQLRANLVTMGAYSQVQEGTSRGDD